MNIDWKDKLASLKAGVVEEEGKTDSSFTHDEPMEKAPSTQKKDTLHILLDKKGRKGKMATIIEGFTLPDDEVEKIASELKKKIGTGGSSRGGEILLQGDWREKAAACLREQGFKIK